jgi:hypothetical protein
MQDQSEFHSNAPHDEMVVIGELPENIGCNDIHFLYNLDISMSLP